MLVYDTPGPITATVEIIAGELRVAATDRPETVVHVRPADETADRDVRAAEQTRVEFASGVLTVHGPRQPGFGIFGRVGVVVVATQPTATRWSAAVSGDGGLHMSWLAATDVRACQLANDELAAYAAAVGDLEEVARGPRHRLNP